MEILICGRPDFDVEWLKTRTSYSGSVSASTPTITKLWEVLTEFQPEERGAFLRFVYGQTRLPPAIGGSSQELSIESLEKYGTPPDQILPEAATCSFKLKIPLVPPSRPTLFCFCYLQLRCKYCSTHPRRSCAPSCCMQSHTVLPSIPISLLGHGRQQTSTPHRMTRTNRCLLLRVHRQKTRRNILEATSALLSSSKR